MRRPVFVRHLSIDEHRLLEELKQTTDRLERVRARIILESNDGAIAAEIAQRVGWTPRAVRRVVQRFNADGMPSVYDQRHQNLGRHRIVTEEWQGYLLSLIEQSPTVYGTPATRWTAMRLSTELNSRYNIRISEERVRYYLRRNGYYFDRSGWCKNTDLRVDSIVDLILDSVACSERTMTRYQTSPATDTNSLDNEY